MQKSTWIKGSTTFYSAFYFIHPCRDTSSCPAHALGLALRVLLLPLLPEEQLTFKEDSKHKPQEKERSWTTAGRKMWQHNAVSTASPVLLIQRVLLISTHLQPLPLWNAAGWIWTRCTRAHQRPGQYPSTPPSRNGILNKRPLIRTGICLNLKHTKIRSALQYLDLITSSCPTQFVLMICKIGKY